MVQPERQMTVDGVDCPKENRFPKYLEPNCKHCCGSIMIQGNLRPFGQENKFKMTGYLEGNSAVMQHFEDVETF